MTADAADELVNALTSDLCASVQKLCAQLQTATRTVFYTGHAC